MPEHPTFTQKEVGATLPQLGDLGRPKSIQRAGERGLLGEVRPAPGPR